MSCRRGGGRAEAVRKGGAHAKPAAELDAGDRLTFPNRRRTLGYGTQFERTCSSVEGY